MFSLSHKIIAYAVIFRFASYHIRVASLWVSSYVPIVVAILLYVVLARENNCVQELGCTRPALSAWLALVCVQ